MKRLVAGLAGIAGIAWFRRRKPVRPDPADELKAKLAQAREADEAGNAGGQAAAVRPEDPVAYGDGGRDEFEAGEKPVDQVPDDLDTRRRDVHDRARAAIDELSSDS